MGKPKPSNGFTLMEVLLVLLLISVCTVSLSSHRDHSLGLFMQQLQSRCLYVQESSFYTKKDKDVTIQDRQAVFDGTRFAYPKGISCTSFSFHYNENGNISKAGTVQCQNGQQRKKMVFQLGMGRIRIE